VSLGEPSLHTLCHPIIHYQCPLLGLGRKLKEKAWQTSKHAAATTAVSCHMSAVTLRLAMAAPALARVALLLFLLLLLLLSLFLLFLFLLLAMGGVRCLAKLPTVVALLCTQGVLQAHARVEPNVSDGIKWTGGENCYLREFMRARVWQNMVDSMLWPENSGRLLTSRRLVRRCTTWAAKIHATLCAAQE